MDEEKLEFFKTWIKFKKQEDKYAFGKITNDVKSLVFFNGVEVFDNIESKARNMIDGQLYRIGKATCGYAKSLGGDGSCEVGARKIDCSAYSENKCAVYTFYKEDISNYNYSLSFEDIQQLPTLVYEARSENS